MGKRTSFSENQQPGVAMVNQIQPKETSAETKPKEDKAFKLK